MLRHALPSLWPLGAGVLVLVADGSSAVGGVGVPPLGPGGGDDAVGGAVTETRPPPPPAGIDALAVSEGDAVTVALDSDTAVVAREGEGAALVLDDGVDMDDGGSGAALLLGDGSSADVNVDSEGDGTEIVLDDDDGDDDG